MARKRFARSHTLASLVLILAFAAPAPAAPQQAGGAPGERTTPPSAAPAGEHQALESLDVRTLDVPIQALDLIYGFDRSWVVSDGIGDQLVFLDFNGGLLGTEPLNLFAVNIYPAAGKIYFNALDGSSRARVGYDFRGTLRGAFLPSGSLAGGSNVAAGPDDYGATLSWGQSNVQLFQANNIYSLFPIPLPAPSRGLDICFGGKFCVGGANAIRTVSRDGIVDLLPSYTLTPRALRFCNDTLWSGTANSIDKITLSGSQTLVQRFLTQFPISSIDCGQNGTALAGGGSGTLYYVDPANNVFRGFQASGLGNVMKVAVGPGAVPRGLLLDDQHVLGNFTLTPDLTWPNDRNTQATRVNRLSLRTLF